jgi:hypothetical protein
MIKLKKISPKKLILIIFSTMLPINFLAMVFVGWSEQGTMPDGTLVTISRFIQNVLLSPMHLIERIFGIEAITGLFFFAADIACIAAWTLLIVFMVENLFRKKPSQKSSSTSRRKS